MSKHKKPKKQRGPRKAPRKSTDKNTTPRPRLVLRFVRWSVAALVAISGMLFSLYPRYLIDTGDTFNPLIPFENPIMITNNGYFPLQIDYDINTPRFVDKFNNTYTNISVGGHHIENLNSDRKMPIDISKFFKTTSSNLIVSEMDLLIKINAKTRIFGNIMYPYTKYEVVRFKLMRKSDGSYVWQPNG